MWNIVWNLGSKRKVNFFQVDVEHGANFWSRVLNSTPCNALATQGPAGIGPRLRLGGTRDGQGLGQA